MNRINIKMFQLYFPLLRRGLRAEALLLMVAFSLSSCEKEIKLDLPDVESRIVIEGRIESGEAPYVILTKSSGYFDPIDTVSYKQLFVNNALVIVSDGLVSDTLMQFQGTPVYYNLNPKIIGAAGKIYTLSVLSEGKMYTSVTSIPPIIPLDSTWFKLQAPSDSLGFIWAHLSDPAGSNSYRWFAKRLGKDDDFIAPLGSVFDDKFIEGKSFDFAYNRGAIPNSDKQDDNNEEAGYFKLKDTLVVKFCTINHDVYEFLRSFDAQVNSNGNPFASPINLKTNIQGGAFGIWAGYGVSIDTIIAK